MGPQSHLATRNLIPISLLEPSQERNTTPERATKTNFLQDNSSQQRQSRDTHKTRRFKSNANKLKPSLLLWRNPRRKRRNRVKAKCHRRHRSNALFPSSPMTKVAAAAPRGRALPPAPIAASCPAQERQAGVAPRSPDSGRGSGAPGLPAPSGPLRTNREAKPIRNRPRRLSTDGAARRTRKRCDIENRSRSQRQSDQSGMRTA